MPPADALIFSLAAGLAVRGAVAEIAPQLSVDLKWPNDLLLGGKKFCGILTEMNAEVTRVRHLVVGVGINVNQVKFPAELREIATSLREAMEGKSGDPAPVRGEFFVGTRQKCEHRGKRRPGGRYRGIGRARVFAGQDGGGVADGGEWNGENHW